MNKIDADRLLKVLEDTLTYPARRGIVNWIQANQVPDHTEELCEALELTLPALELAEKHLNAGPTTLASLQMVINTARAALAKVK